MADAVRAGGERAGVPAVLQTLDLGGVAVRWWQTTALERFVDAGALLRDDAAPDPPYWMHLWPGARALGRILATTPMVRPGTRVLELGCGLGLPALVAARRHARVTASDREHAPLGFVRRSAALNDCRVAVVQMDWAAPAFREVFEVCVGADIAYDAASEPALVAALARLTAPDGVIWLADSVNTARTTLAAALQASGFRVVRHEVAEQEEGHPVWVRVLEARRA